MTELSDQISKHLEFLGFETKVKFDDEDDSEFFVSGTHPKRWNIRVVVDESTFSFLTFVILNNKTFDYKLVNEANKKLRWIKTFIDKDGDLGFYLYLPAEYDRRSFGLAVDRFESLIDSALKITNPEESGEH